jgi:signal transduction histidine kinase
MHASEKLRCNSRIAAGLLDSLAATGNHAGHGCVRRVYENENVNPRSEGAWISHSVIDSAFRSLDAGRDLAKRVGYSLVSTERIGFMLYSGGVATIEKAYRRCEPMFPREERDGRFHTLEVNNGRARIAYHPGAARHSKADQPLQDKWNANFCGVREGMLEALPLSFGLLPARVKETECVGRGASHCVFDVHFEARSTRGAWLGLGIGAATAIAIGALLVPEASLLARGAIGVLIAVLSSIAGFAVDLSRQLQAVAGARRGHLALLEQADRALSEKMDQLATLGGRAEASAGESTERLRRLLEERQDAIAGDGARKIDVDDSADADAGYQSSNEWVQLAEVVGAAAEAVRSTMLSSQHLKLEVEDNLPRVRCSKFQFEQVADQLIKNAVSASFDDGTVHVVLRSIASGVELMVLDQGCGVPEELLDQLFDPFAEEPTAGTDGGLGLAICHRTVVEHGGQMTVASDDFRGTCVTVVLPRETESEAR